MVLAPAVQVRVDDLRALVAQRTIDAEATRQGLPILAIDLQLTEPLPLSVAARLDEETQASMMTPQGIIAPLLIHISGDRIRFELDPLQPGALRLETLGAALAYSGNSLGPGAAAAIVLTVASLVSQLHDDHGPRPHGELHQGTILVSPGGAVALLGSGHPILQAFLIPPPPTTLDVPQAPELASGAAPSAAADVFALAAVYAQLLAGRRASTPAPEALPDPRPGLVRLLGESMSPHPNDRPRDVVEFGNRLRQELHIAGIDLADASELDQLLRTYVPESVPSGDISLLAAATATDALEGYLTGDVPGLSLGQGAAVPRAVSSASAPGLTGSPPPARPGSSVPARPGSSVPARPGSVPAHAGSATGKPPTPANPWAAVLESDDLRTEDQGLDSAAAAARPPVDDLILERAPRAPDTARRSSKLPAPEAQSRRSPPLRVKGAERPTIVEAESPPGIGRVLLATGGALAIGVGLMTALISFRSAPPSPEPPPAPPAATKTPAAPKKIQSVRVGAPKTPPAQPDRKQGGATSDRATTAFLSIVSTPLGAQVELDGEPLGTTPIVQRRNLPPTDYILRVTKDGFTPWQQVVRPGPNGALNVSAVLVPKP